MLTASTLWGSNPGFCSRICSHNPGATPPNGVHSQEEGRGARKMKTGRRARSLGGQDGEWVRRPTRQPRCVFRTGDHPHIPPPGSHHQHSPGRAPPEPKVLSLNQTPLPLAQGPHFPAQTRISCQMWLSHWEGKSEFIHANVLTKV